MELQDRFDELYESLHVGWIGRAGYARAVDELAAAEPDRVARLMARRRDSRTLGEFALWVYDKTLRERYLMEACWPQVARMVGGASYDDNGVANDGRLVLDVGDRGREPDFLVRREDGSSFPLEVKFSPTQRYLTYKADDLRRYLQVEGARILTVASPRKIPGDGDRDADPRYGFGDAVLQQGSWLTIYDHDAIRRLLAIGEAGAHWGFGGKPTVRVHARDFDEVAPTVELELELAHQER